MLLSRANHRGRPDDLRRPAIVFSPHFDDETLACGGTIIKKKKAGAQVSIVFMTDGSSSHANLIPPGELSAIRISEAFAAAHLLGLDDGDLHLLKLKERKLSRHIDDAVDMAAELLLRLKPAEVFVPHLRDVHPDHVATNKIVVLALAKCGLGAIVNEYPVWLWNHWPWVRVPRGGVRQTIFMLRRSLRSGFGLRLFKDFRHSVAVSDVLDAKRAALAAYKSQMTRLKFGERWPILHDVSDGEFLECFFQNHEIFRQHGL